MGMITCMDAYLHGRDWLASMVGDQGLGGCTPMIGIG